MTVNLRFSITYLIKNSVNRSLRILTKVNFNEKNINNDNLIL